MENADNTGKGPGAQANSSRPPAAPKAKTEPGAKTAKVSGSGVVRPPSAGISAWEDAAGPHDCDLLAYLGKAEDAVVPGGVRSGSSPGHRTLSQTGDGNLTQALLAARVAAEAERSAAQLGQRHELERRASQASRGDSSSVSGASDRAGGSGKPPRAPEQKPKPLPAAAAEAVEAADPCLQGLLSDDEGDDDELVDLMEADDDVLFGGCGGVGDKERSRGSGTGSGKGAASAATPPPPALAPPVSATAQPALDSEAPGPASTATGRSNGGSAGGTSSGAGVPSGSSRGSSAEGGGAHAPAAGRSRKPPTHGPPTPRGRAAAQAAAQASSQALHGQQQSQALYGQQQSQALNGQQQSQALYGQQQSQALYGQQQSQALLSYQQQYYSQLQLQQQQQYTPHGGLPAPSIPVAQVGEGLRQLQMQPRRAFTPGQANRSPMRGSGYVVATAANARVLTPPGSPTSRGGQQPVGSGAYEPSGPGSGSVYVGANSAPQPLLGRPASPQQHVEAAGSQQQHPRGSQQPHGASPRGAHDHASPHAAADGGGPEATAALLAAFAPATSPHRHGGGFNMSSWGSPLHHGGWAAGAGGGGGGGGGGRFSSFSAGYTGGLVYRSMPISQVLGSAAEDGAAAGGGGGGVGARSSLSPGRLSGRAGKAPTLGLMRDRHGSANATSAGPLAAAAAAAVAAAGSRAATSPHSLRPATSPSRSRSLASFGTAVAGPLEPGYARAYAAPPSRQSPRRASHGAPPAPLVIGGVVMSPPPPEGLDGAGGPAGETGTGGAGGPARGPMVPAMPQYLHAPPPIRHCGFGPRAGGHGGGGAASSCSGSTSPPTLAMGGAAGPGSAGSATVAPSVFLGSRAKATDERIRSALLAKVLASVAGGKDQPAAPPPQHHMLMLAHQQQQALHHGHGHMGAHGHQQHQQHQQQQAHSSPGGAAAEDAAAVGHSVPIAAIGMAPAGANASASHMHRQDSLPHLLNAGAAGVGVGEHVTPPAVVLTHPGHAGGFVPHSALPAGPTLAGRIGGGLTPGHGHRGAAGDRNHPGASARSYSFDSPRNGALSHA
ncbi:hypothetical protein HYH02_013077 [Chlamydomonas schloesseri]|uniref:Uncharacterized protein n=1 Tax=Chlamydomonas schloesseri TaxID=2026947 RepID=A0A835T5K7_9CHLO|nr:hypothetical protein HYH02_013077 [Chlamydomonas schloesseri]|eukprot:KAG2432006.1 hypothetical protein HYH02_013077 [Chlamydomonas schloesseri]